MARRLIDAHWRHQSCYRALPLSKGLLLSQTVARKMRHGRGCMMPLSLLFF